VRKKKKRAKTQIGMCAAGLLLMVLMERRERGGGGRRRRRRKRRKRGYRTKERSEPLDTMNMASMCTL